MKLLIVTALREYRKAVADILQNAAITIFSMSETVGHKDDHTTNVLDEWFASGEENFDSIFIFSFTNYNKAARALQLIKEYNKNEGGKFPIRGFVVPVEQASYSM